MNVNGDVPVTLAGLRVMPVGSPEAVSAMLPVKPPDGVTVSVVVPVVPATRDRLVADMLKSAAVETAEGVSVYMAV